MPYGKVTIKMYKPPKKCEVVWLYWSKELTPG